MLEPIPEAPGIRNQREHDMVTARMAGKSLQEIAEDHGLTLERVRQILKECGLNPKHYLTTNRTIYKRKKETATNG